MSARLLQLTPEQLDEAQRAVYDGITGGDRLKGPQHFPVVAADGSLNGPFGVMLHAPGVGGALQELGAAIRYRTGLSARIREIAILLVATAHRSDFEWWAHERVGRAVGLTAEELDQLSRGRFETGDATERAAAELCTTLLACEPVNADDYARYVDVLGAPGIIELTALVGYYRTLAQLMAVFDVGVPD